VTSCGLAWVWFPISRKWGSAVTLRCLRDPDGNELCLWQYIG
jgi:hypothetical protein